MSETPTPLLQVAQLSVAINTETTQKIALQTVSFALARGEVLALVGESGSGKSICAQAIMGLLPKPSCRVSGGTIEFEGQTLAQAAQFQPLRGRKMAMIFQEPTAALNPVQTVAQQLGEVINLHQADAKKNVNALLARSLQEVGLDDSLLTRYPHQLSGGQCQRLMIAMALAGNPALLIADEPTTALDTVTQQQILNLLRQLQANRGLAILFITHDLSLIANWADRVAVLQHGELKEIGATADIFTKPQHPYTQQLLSALRGKPLRDTTGNSSEPVMRVIGLNQHYRQADSWFKPDLFHALKNVSFDLLKGETLAVVGQSGSGKSTLGRALLVLDKPSSGQVIFKGQDLCQLPQRVLQAQRAKLQVVFQDTLDSLNPRHTVERILTEPLQIHSSLNRDQRRQRAAQALELVELPADSLQRFPHEFSGGQRQRLNIARAIINQPDVLVCDEALSALDVTTQQHVLTLLSKLKRELGLSLLFISHDLACVRHFADRVAVMHQGELVELGATDQVLSHAQHPATQQLLAAEPRLAIV